MRRFRFNRADGRSSGFGKALAVAAVVLVGLLAYLTVDPEAHQFFHADAGHCDHQCVVTAFAAGEGLCIAPPIEVRPVPVVVCTVEAAARELSVEAPCFLLRPICGPPLA